MRKQSQPTANCFMLPLLKTSDFDRQQRDGHTFPRLLMFCSNCFWRRRRGAALEGCKTRPAKTESAMGTPRSPLTWRCGTQTRSILITHATFSSISAVICTAPTMVGEGGRWHANKKPCSVGSWSYHVDCSLFGKSRRSHQTRQRWWIDLGAHGWLPRAVGPDPGVACLRGVTRHPTGSSRVWNMAR